MNENNKIRNLSELKNLQAGGDFGAIWQQIDGSLTARAHRRKFFYLGIAASLLVVFSTIGLLGYFHCGTCSDKSVNQVDTQLNNENIIGLKRTESRQNSVASGLSGSSANIGLTNKTGVTKSFSNTFRQSNDFKNHTVASNSIEPWVLKSLGVSSFAQKLIPDLLMIADKPFSMVMAIPADKKPERFPHMSMEVFATATPSVVNLVTASSSQFGWLVNKDFNKIASKSEFAAAGAQVNAGLQFNLGSSWFVQTGVGYSEKREMVNYNYTLKEFTIVRESEKKLEYAPLSPQQWINVQHRGANTYRFAEIPLLVGYKLPVSKKLELRVRGGVSYWRLISKTGQKIDPTSLNLNQLSEVKNYVNNNLGVQINTGLNYKLSPNWSILAEPGGALGLTDLTKGSPVQTKPYNYGLNIGVQYKLK